MGRGFEARAVHPCPIQIWGPPGGQGCLEAAVDRTSRNDITTTTRAYYYTSTHHHDSNSSATSSTDYEMVYRHPKEIEIQNDWLLGKLEEFHNYTHPSLTDMQ